MHRLRFALCLAPLLALGPSLAQDDLSTPDAISLRNQILQLQAQVNQLEANQQNGGEAAPVTQGAAPAPQTAAGGSDSLLPELLNRVSTLEDQVRTLNGKVDELTNQLNQQNQTFTKQIGDINFQLQGGAAGGVPASGTAAPSSAPDTSGGAAPASLTPPAEAAPPSTSNLPTGVLGTLPADQVPQGQTAPADQTTPPPAAAPGPTATDILREGTVALEKRDYATAAKDARAVLVTNRTTPIGYDAQFLLARALAGRREWQDAAVAYDDTYRRSLYGAHSQEAQLGEARALLALGDKGAACGALNRLLRQYPRPRPDLAPSVAALRARTCTA